MKKIALAAAVFAVFGAQSAFAQTTANATVSGTVDQSLYIALDNAGQAVTFANSSAADFNTGYKQVDGGVLTYKGNVTHTVSVAADAATMTASTGGRADKPASDVSWSTGSTYTALSTTSANMAAAVVAGESTAPLSYRMALAWADDTPGTYSIGVTYTIAAD